MSRYISRRRRSRQRGLTLFEVLIVVAILALISAGVAVGVLGHFERTRVKLAQNNARTLRGAVKAWWIDHEEDACPTVPELIIDGALDKDSPRQDPWGRPWRIECRQREVTVISDGPDRKPSTDDDIRIPPSEAG